VLLRILALSAFAISVSGGYAWLVSDRVPQPSDLIVAEGSVVRAEYLRTATHSSAVTSVKFWLQQNDQPFYYEDFLPNFGRAKQLITEGAVVRLCTLRRKHEIWELQVGGEILADRDQTARAHHTNGTWGGIVSIAMALSGAYLFRCSGKLFAVRPPTPRRPIHKTS